MAAYMPNQNHQPYSKPLPDFPPHPAPDHAIFPMDKNAAHHSEPSVPQIPLRPKNFARVSGDYRERGDMNGNGTAGIGSGKPFSTHLPGQNVYNYHGSRDFVGSAAMFGASKSPPAKNTSHVPCKFYKIGQCQAGTACPFSHETDASKAETACKYFTKGNCKFGHRCMLLHVLPDGKIANRPPGYVPPNPDIVRRMNHQDYLHPDALLSNDAMSRRNNGDPNTYGMQYSAKSDGDPNFASHPPIPIYNNPPPLDSAYNAYNYGSPRDDIHASMSPIAHLSTMDAPLPASFDSQGTSFMARHGPIAASMPSRFSLDSPPSSLPKKATLPNDALRNLHSSAFGRENGFSRSMQRGTSPSAPLDENSISHRMMHSQRVTRPRFSSASVPRYAEDWEDSVMFGEPGEPTLMVPDVLSDLMTSQEKERRLSGSVSGNVTPGEGSSKVGSPSGSRFGAFFQKQPKNQDGSTGMSTSPFGHVGSPLRNSTLHFGTSLSNGYRSTSQTLPIGNTLSSPPRQSSMSMISQQLQRTCLGNKVDLNETASGLHPASARTVTAPITIRPDRTVSNSNTPRNRIDEEQGDCMFSLDEEEFSTTKKVSNGAWNSASESRSSPTPRPGTVGDGRIARSRRAEEAAGSVGL